MTDKETVQPTTYRCEGCGYTHGVSLWLAGRLGKCPNCGKMNRIHRGGDEPASTESTPEIRFAPHDRTYAGGTTPLAPLPPTRDHAGRKGSGGTIAAQASWSPAKAGQDIAAGEAAEENRSEPHKQGFARTIDCPYCREEILASARKCKHCNEYLGETATFLAKHNPREQKGNYRLIIICGSAALVLVSAMGLFLLRGGASSDASIAVGTADAGSSGTGGGHVAKNEGGQDGADKQAGQAPVIAKLRLDGLLNSLKKELQDGQATNLAGNTICFVPSEGAEQWAAEVKNNTATITIPYKLEALNPVPSMPCSRGVLLVEIRAQGSWAVETVKRESHVDVLDGKDNPIDEENRTKVPVLAKDGLFLCIDAAIKRIQPAGG